MEYLFPLLLIVLIALMFMTSRKQKKTIQAMYDMQDELIPGDNVVTTAGLHGTVVSSREDTIDLMIADGVVTTWDKRVIRAKVDDQPTSDLGLGTLEGAGGTEGAAGAAAAESVEGTDEHPHTENRDDNGATR